MLNLDTQVFKQNIEEVDTNEGYIMKNTDTDKVYPMHCWNDTSVIERLKAMECSEIYRHKIFSY